MIHNAATLAMPTDPTTPHFANLHALARSLVFTAFEFDAAGYYVNAGACAMEHRHPVEYAEWHRQMSHTLASPAPVHPSELLNELKAVQESIVDNKAAVPLFRRATEVIECVQISQETFDDEEPVALENNVVKLIAFCTQNDHRHEKTPVAAAIYLNGACIACSLLGVEGAPSLNAMSVTANVIAFENSVGELSIGRAIVPDDWSVVAIRRYAANDYQYRPECDPHWRPDPVCGAAAMGV